MALVMKKSFLRKKLMPGLNLLRNKFVVIFGQYSLKVDSYSIKGSGEYFK